MFIIQKLLKYNEASLAVFGSVLNVEYTTQGLSRAISRHTVHNSRRAKQLMKPGPTAKCTAGLRVSV